MTTASRHDAVVVGGRIGGLLTAAWLADTGMTVLVLEARSLSGPVLSTHFFRGAGLVGALDDLGVLEAVLATGAPPLRYELRYAAGSPEPLERPPQEPGAVGFCLSVRRSTLDPLVAAAAVARGGVELRTNSPACGLVRDSEGAVAGVSDSRGGRHEAPLVVGADGRRSRTADWADAATRRRERATRVMYYRYVVGWRAPDGGAAEAPEFSVLGDEIAYVFPSDGATACVALSVSLGEYHVARRDAAAYFEHRLLQHRGLWPRYRASRPWGRLWAAPPEDSVVRTASGPGWALVGDSGLHQDPWSGLGLDTAARSARLLQVAIRSTGHRWPATYAAARDDAELARWERTTVAARDLRALAG